MYKHIQTFSFFVFGIIIAVSVVFAAGGLTNVKDILEKKGNTDGGESIITHEEFNIIVDSLKGIENEEGIFKMKTGFVLENRTDNPSTPELGRIWFKK